MPETINTRMVLGYEILELCYEILECYYLMEIIVITKLFILSYKYESKSYKC